MIDVEICADGKLHLLEAQRSGAAASRSVAEMDSTAVTTRSLPHHHLSNGASFSSKCLKACLVASTSNTVLSPRKGATTMRNFSELH